MEIAYQCRVAEEYETCDEWVCEKAGAAISRRPLPRELRRVFAGLVHTEAALLDFAAQFGLPFTELLPWAPARLLNGVPRSGCPLDRWREEVYALHDAGRLYDALRERRVDERALKAVAARVGYDVDRSHQQVMQAWSEDLDRATQEAVDAVMAAIAAGRCDDPDEIARAGEAARAAVGWPRGLGRDDLWHLLGGLPAAVGQERLTLGWLALTAALNVRLHEVPHKFLWPGLQPPYRLVVRRNGNKTVRESASLPNRPTLMLRPQNLLGAMWAQFAFAVETGEDVKQCEWPGCQAWIEVKPDGKPHRYCGDTCRQRAHRAGLSKPWSKKAGGVQ